MKNPINLVVKKEETNQVSEEPQKGTAVEEVNQPPKADAGDNQKVSASTEVSLDGSKSSDEDGKLVTYKWEQTDDPNVYLKNADQESASFIAPSSSEDSKLDFDLTVVNDKDASGSDDVTLEVEKEIESQSN